MNTGPGTQKNASPHQLSTNRKRPAKPGPMKSRPSVYPVILCGGAGTRLWPASRPSRPKHFIPLAGNRSLFQETAQRVAPLASGDGRLVVVGGAKHQKTILHQLSEIGVSAVILLEPEGRDSAAAMAAAAIWTRRQSPDAVNLFVPSDHHIPDHSAFQNAVALAVEASLAGRIVTLGIVPTSPSSAYGYIAPANTGLSEVAAFVEKPTESAAKRYIDNGYLWNSGNFIAQAKVLEQEFVQSTASLHASVRDAVDTAVHDSSCLILGESFRSAAKISVDYAIMEKTRCASVLPVSFEWSDLGAWDSVHASGEGDVGLHVLEDSEGCLIRARDGVLVAAIGLRNIAIVVEQDAVLVADLKRSQDVKKVVRRLGDLSPRHLDFEVSAPPSFYDSATRLSAWLRSKALPIWCTLGQNDSGAFEESLALDGRRVRSSKRARVQARQIYAYGQAGMMGWQGPWRRAVESGMDYLDQRFTRPDGLIRSVLDMDGQPIDEHASLYDQAFLLLALAIARRSLDRADMEVRAAKVRELLLMERSHKGGLTEVGTKPYQANPLMHMLEASMGWEAVSADEGWRDLSDSIVAIARTRLIDQKSGLIGEFFDENWTPPGDRRSELIEPGHQLEWSGLLAQHARARGDSELKDLAWSLYLSGLDGYDPHKEVIIDSRNINGTVRSERARLWPQTEWLKASLIFATLLDDGRREFCLNQAARAEASLWRYLTPEGLWKDKLLEIGRFIDEPAPASSFYHIIAAYAEVERAVSNLSPDRKAGVSLF